MTELEMIEAVYTIRQAGAADISNFVTIVSAYLVVAYLAGDKLLSFQLWAISVVYRCPLWAQSV